PYGPLPSLTTVLTPQLSPLVGVPSTTLVALQEPTSALTVTSAGQLMLGAWLSTTITCWVQLLELPCTSVTVQTPALVPTASVTPQLTALPPSRKVAPPGGLHATVPLVQLPLALTVSATLPPQHRPASVALT